MKRLSFPLFVSLDKACELAFTEASLGAVKLQIQYMQDGCHSLKQLDKFRKLGSDTATRLKNDVRHATLLAYLKQLEGLNITKDKAAKAMAALEHSDNVIYGKLRDISLCDLLRPFSVPEDMAEAISEAVSSTANAAEEALTKLSDITNDKHLPDTSWKGCLQKDCSLTALQNCVAANLDFDVTGLEPALEKLKEAIFVLRSCLAGPSCPSKLRRLSSQCNFIFLTLAPLALAALCKVEATNLHNVIDVS